MSASTTLGSAWRFFMMSSATRFTISASQPLTPSNVSELDERVDGAEMYSSVTVLEEAGALYRPRPFVGIGGSGRRSSSDSCT